MTDKTQDNSKWPLLLTGAIAAKLSYNIQYNGLHSKPPAEFPLKDVIIAAAWGTAAAVTMYFTPSYEDTSSQDPEGYLGYFSSVFVGVEVGFSLAHLMSYLEG